MPTVSINLCCYNSEKYLRETLDSVVNQTYSDWELVIINDGSSDSTEAIVKEYINHGFPIIYHYQENHGLGYSRNVALENSKGNYIAFIDHDDEWLPEKLAKQVECLNSNANIDFVYTNYFYTKYFLKNDMRAIRLRKKQPEGDVFKKFLICYPVHVSTVLIRRSAINKLSYFFNPRFIMVEEYDFFMRILYTSKAKYLHEPLATYRYHAESSAMKQQFRLTQETLCVLETLSYFIPDFKTKYSRILCKLRKNNRMYKAFKIAKDELAEGEIGKAHETIRPYKYYNLKTLVFYIITCIPSRVASMFWLFVLRIKNFLKIDF